MLNHEYILQKLAISRINELRHESQQSRFLHNQLKASTASKNIQHTKDEAACLKQKEMKCSFPQASLAKDLT